MRDEITRPIRVIRVGGRDGAGPIDAASEPPEPARPPGRGTTPPELQDVRGRSILIVDDDPLTIMLMRRMLDAYRNVRFATRGDEALRLVRAAPPDLILLDGKLPGCSGLEVTAELKADPALRDIPIIFVTAHDDLAFETRAMDLGAADFISKPVSGPRLELRVRLHLRLKQQLDELSRLARLDSLTGMVNRRTLDGHLASEWSRAARASTPLSLLLIDIDHFKGFNDTHGHLEGDRCLRAVADVIRTTVRRPHDLAARFGGEEFAVVLPHTPDAGAVQVAEQIRAAVAGAALPHHGSAVADHVTVSIGAATITPATPAPPRDPGWDHVQLIELADTALYSAKRAGRDRVIHAPGPAHDARGGIAPPLGADLAP